MMTTECWPATEIQRMEEEIWTLTLKGDDIEAYNNRFHELALMCPDLVPNEKKKIERYMKGFPERIKGNITSARPTSLHEAVNLAGFETIKRVALTWWNSHVKTVTLEVAQALPWKTLKKMMTDKYCPRGEIKKLEKSDRVEKYIGGLPDMIHVSVKATRPKTMQEVIEFSTKLMDKRSRDVVENKRKFKGTSRNYQNRP
nr:reverse transcriptase domain-containing protein [Tanacetum cinerariifolium]